MFPTVPFYPHLKMSQRSQRVLSEWPCLCLLVIFFTLQHCSILACLKIETWHHLLMDYQKKTSDASPLFTKNIFHDFLSFLFWKLFFVKDHLFMPHVRPVKLAGGVGQVGKVQNYFNAFVKLSHPLTRFTVLPPLWISDLYSLPITLLAL